MCIFYSPVNIVAGSVIIVGQTDKQTVRVIYSNRVACDNGNIMILPVDSDQKVKLTVLKDKYKKIGKNIVDGYQQYIDDQSPSYKSQSYSLSNSEPTRSMVAVIQYGPYDVSVTSELMNVDWEHFGGLNNRDSFLNLMSDKYPQQTFIVAKIRPNNTEQNKLPICYEFTPRTSTIQLPTFHIHDGKAESNPDWDHHIVVINGQTDNENNISRIITNKYKPNLNNLNDFFQDDTINKPNEVQFDSNLIPRYFDILNDLTTDNIFNDNPYDAIQYINVLKIDSEINYPNVDISCTFDNNIQKIQIDKQKENIQIPQTKQTNKIPTIDNNLSKFNDYPSWMFIMMITVIIFLVGAIIQHYYLKH